MGSRGGASQAEDTERAKVLRPAWAWQGKELPSAACRGSVRGGRPREEVLRGSGALWTSPRGHRRDSLGGGHAGGPGCRCDRLW